MLALLASIALGIAYLYGPKSKGLHIAALACVGLFIVFTVVTDDDIVIGQVLQGAIAGNVLNLAGLVPDLLFAIGLIVSVSIVMKYHWNPYRSAKTSLSIVSEKPTAHL